MTCPQPTRHGKTLLGILRKRVLLLVADLKCKRVKTESFL